MNRFVDETFYFEGKNIKVVVFRNDYPTVCRKYCKLCKFCCKSMNLKITYFGSCAERSYLMFIEI